MKEMNDRIMGDPTNIKRGSYVNNKIIRKPTISLDIVKDHDLVYHNAPYDRDEMILYDEFGIDPNDIIQIISSPKVNHIMDLYYGGCTLC